MLLSCCPHAWALLAGAWLRGLKFQFGSCTFKKLFLPHFTQRPLSHWRAGPCRHSDVGCAKGLTSRARRRTVCVSVYVSGVCLTTKHKTHPLSPNWFCLKAAKQVQLGLEALWKHNTGLLQWNTGLYHCYNVEWVHFKIWRELTMNGCLIHFA